MFFTGSGAAGKTSLIQLLLKKKFDEKHHSTNVVHTNHAVSVRTAAFHGSPSQIGDIQWVEMDINLEINFLQSVLLPSHLSETSLSLKATAASEITVKKTNLTLDSSIKHACRPSKQHSVFTKLLSSVFKPSVKDEKLTILNKMLDLSSPHNAVTHQPGEVLNMITLLDTGGQPEYIHLLPTVNIEPTVTFVVHDLSKSLDDQVLVEYSQHGEHMFVPYHLNYSNMDMIKLLMSAANDAVERPPTIPHLVATPGPNNTSYLCLVGTHADKVPADIVVKTGKQLTALVNNTKCKPALWHKKDGNVLFTVDNTTAGRKYREDPTAKLLRTKIEIIASERDIYEMPITWMLLHLEIQQVCSSKQKSYIKFDECVALARNTGVMSNKTEIKSVLLYYHLLRVLIYFEEVPGLCDYVIVDHQWWFDKLSSIVTSTLQQEQLNFQAVQKLKYEGILSIELLQRINWKDEIKEEFFLSLLVHMKIIAVVRTKDNDKEQYFIPYVLPTYNIHQESEFLAQYGHLQGEPLLIQFYSGLLPRGFFCSLIVELLQNPPNDWQPYLSQEGMRHTFSNLITFSLPNGFSLSLLDKVSYLEVQLKHPEKAFRFFTHKEVFSQLIQALICTSIHLNFDHTRLQYGVSCDCGKITEDHIALLPTTLQSILYAKCSIATNPYHMKLSSSHLIWFSKGQLLSLKGQQCF